MSNQALSPYTYPSLLPRTHIRLLTISRTTPNGSLLGDLASYPLPPLVSYPPFFVAISWTWPPPPLVNSAVLDLGDSHLHISERLNSLIHDLFPIDGSPATVRIWIDAVCINQGSNVEKGTHVPLMHRVYGMAVSCVAWLGEKQTGFGDAVIDAKSAYAAIKMLNDMTEEDPQSGDSNRDMPFWRALGNFCDRDWWYRTWIVQEVAVARRVNLNVGGQYVGWDTLVRLVSLIMDQGKIEWCRGPRSTGETRPDGFGVLRDLNWARGMFQGDTEGNVIQTGMDLGYLLRMVRLKEVTKPVDKIYGLLGLVGDEVRNLVQVNYAEADRGFYIAYEAFVRNLIRRDNMAFWLLCMAPSRERPAELRSWCPNFNSLTPNYLDLYHQPFQRFVPNPGFLREQGIRVDEPDDRKLVVSGFVTDTVEQVIHIGGPNAFAVGHQEDRPPSTAFLNRYDEALELAKQHYSTVAEAKEAMIRSLVMNTDSNFRYMPVNISANLIEAFDTAISSLDNERAASNLSLDQVSSTTHFKDAQAFLKQLGWWQERPLFLTRKGRIGRGSWAMRSGDVVCAFYGAAPLFVLRNDNDHDDLFTLVGDAYLHKSMAGEASHMPNEEKNFILT
jgi:hypothetical protein